MESYNITHKAKTLPDAIEWINETIKHQESLLNTSMTNPFRMPKDNNTKEVKECVMHDPNGTDCSRCFHSGNCEAEDNEETG